MPVSGEEEVGGRGLREEEGAAANVKDLHVPLPPAEFDHVGIEN